MGFDWHVHRRRSLRLKGYDYSNPGGYFVTLCVKDRQCLFGNVVDAGMVLDEAGRMVQTVWDEMPDFYPGFRRDAFIIMPNHVHGIFNVVGAGPCACPRLDQHKNGQPQGVAPTLGLPDLVNRFKSMTTHRYIEGVENSGWPSFQGKLWQRNYFEHIIRNQGELTHLRYYILTNPERWPEDPLNTCHLNR